jgi:tRNA-specific 2-thiouridylase
MLWRSKMTCSSAKFALELQRSTKAMPKVYVGMSGGVDSSVTAALLKEQGYDVTGVYMKNWSQDLPGMVCPWKEDYQDAKRVAVQLGIPFKMYDFQKEYRQKVVDYMTREYQAGRTPNPDVMCNQEVKFKLFLETALADGADMIATGHYARVEDGRLRTAANADKDQTYFLYRVSEDALRRSLMPIGEFETKAEVRAFAKKFGLATAEKKDSQGICFVGKVGIRDFLTVELGPQPAGDIIDQNGVHVGRHDGAIYYTIGQRHGLNTGGGLPFYVTGKDMAKNEVYVTTNLQDENLWRKELQLADLHWINAAPEPGRTYQVRTRYRAPLVKCTLQHISADPEVRPPKGGASGVRILLDEEVRAITPGQSAVIYDGERVVGGGIVV